MCWSMHEEVRTDYRMWKPEEPEWCVVASERIWPDHVVSVQFIKQRPRDSVAPTPPWIPAKERELEPA